MTAAFKSKRFLVFGGSAALCLLFLLVSTMLQANKQRVVRAQHKALTEELSTLKQTVDTVDIAKLEEENRALAAELEEIEQSLPEQEYVPTFLDQIQNLAVTTGTTMAEWRPGEVKTGLTVGGGGEGDEEQQGQSYSAMDMDVTLDASYKGAFSFIKQLGTMGKIISVESVEISKAGADAFRHDGGAAATVRLSMKAYILPPRSGFPGEITVKLYT